MYNVQYNDDKFDDLIAHLHKPNKHNSHTNRSKLEYSLAESA